MLGDLCTTDIHLIDSYWHGKTCVCVGSISAGLCNTAQCGAIDRESPVQNAYYLPARADHVAATNTLSCTTEMKMESIFYTHLFQRICFVEIHSTGLIMTCLFQVRCVLPLQLSSTVAIEYICWCIRGTLVASMLKIWPQITRSLTWLY